MIGTRLGPYEITAKLGEGGMGEVYRAHDTKLKRDVAIKVLPAAFTEDRERLARFEREAQLLAQLHHPNIASIFGMEESDGTRALVMELVEGPTLAERLEKGPLPFQESLSVSLQITRALEEAHEKGIVHRDLKPQNIKASAEGKVKVLDFGLAKAMDSGSGFASPADFAHSPTVTFGATREGVILGTAAYMSPEQARGGVVDKRADIWAFGVVLHEMLTGSRLFAGESVVDVLGAVMRQPVDFEPLSATTPRRVVELLRHCLERNPKNRLRDIGDARIVLEEALAAPEVEPSPRESPAAPVPAAWRRLAPWLVALAAALVAAWAITARTPAAPPSAQGHFSISLPEDAPIVTLDVPEPSEGPLAVSPDGRAIVYVAPHGEGTRLYVREMADLIPRALPGTEGARSPVFSPDGKWIAYFSQGKLRKTPLAGGTPATLAEAPGGYGASWGPAGEIVFAPHLTSGLFAVSENGGAPRRVTTLDLAAGDDGHVWPQILPGHRAALFTSLSWSRETMDVFLVDFATGARRLVQAGTGAARYVPSAPGARSGHLVFVRAETLVAAPFDPDKAEVAGPAVALVERVRAAQFDISASGVLAYVPGTGTAPVYSLVQVDLAGQAHPVNDLLRGYEDLHLSPDGRRVALTIEEAGPESAAHVWLADIARGTLTRVTFDGYSRDPVWAPDGESIVYGSKRGESTFGIYRQRLDGRSPEELIWKSPIPIWPDPQSFTPDGKVLVFTTKGPETSDDIWTLSLEGDRTAQPWLATPAIEWGGRLSPDGRFMAYNSIESGREEVYVQPFPGPGSKWLVSQGGGVNPIWSRDGRRLFYRRGSQFFAVEVETGAGFTAGQPALLFSGRYRLTGRDFDVSPDGSRFVTMLNSDPRTTPTVNVLLDWWRATASRGTEGSR